MTGITKKSQKRRNEIIKAACTLFTLKGYESTSMRDVMAHLNIAKGTIYHHFVSKEALLEAVVEDLVIKKVKEIKNKLDALQGNALQKMQTLIQKGKISKERQEILKALHSPNNEVMHIRLLGATLLKIAPLYETLIRQGCKENIFHTETPLECAEFMLSAIQFLTDMGIYRWSEEDLKRRALAFPALVERLLSAPTGSFKFLLELI